MIVQHLCLCPPLVFNLTSMECRVLYICVFLELFFLTGGY